MAPISLLLTHYGENWVRGSERCLLNLLTHIDRARFHPMLWCNSEKLAAEACKLDVAAIVDEFPILLGWQAPRFDWRGHWRLRIRAKSLIRQYQIQVIHANSDAPCQWLVPVSRCMGIPLLCHLHARYQPRDRYSLRVHGADLLIGVSKPVLDGWRQDSMPEAKLLRIANGIDREYLLKDPPWPVRERLGIGTDESVLAAVGSLITRKGFDLLLRSLRRLLDEKGKAHLLIVGDGEEGDRLQALTQELGLCERVHFLGERQDVGAILRGGVDLVVSGAREEVFGLTLVEAGALGLPVTAFAVGGIPEVVAHNLTGHLLPPGDWQAMASSWLLLTRDPERCRQMGEAGRHRAQTLFSVRRYVSDIEQAYERLLALGAGKSSFWPVGLGHWLALRLRQAVGLSHGATQRLT
jgi:glycosyltransferase involved in cell wall biosynthesis